MRRDRKPLLVPPEKIVRKIARNKKTELKRMIEMFGENVAAQIMVEFAGETIFFPRYSTLYRTSVVSYVKAELENLDGEEFEKRVRQLAHLFQKPERLILRINENGKYA